jgi:curved DNA-binding protein CbpA
VTDEPFVDYYDLLQLSPNADEDTIDRVFRHLAKKCHPDIGEASDGTKFRQLARARAVLGDPETRAGYDAKYQEYWNRKWKLASEATQGTAFAEDTATRQRILSLLYVQRRTEMRMPGLGEYEISRLLRAPVEMVEFHVWYLREKGLVHRLDTGQLAITALGVDRIERDQLRISDDRLLSTGSAGMPPESWDGDAARQSSGSLEDGRHAS